MTALNTILNSPLVYRLGFTLLHSLWEGAAVIAVLLLGGLAMRKSSSQARYVVTCSAMLALIVVPFLTFFIINAPHRSEVVAAPIAVTPPPINSKPTAFSVAEKAVHSEPASARPVSIDQQLRPIASSIVPTHLESPSVPLHERLAAVTPWIVVAWLIGVALLALRNIGGWIALQQLRSLTTFPAGDEIDRCVRKLAGRLGIQRPVRILQSTLAKTPMVIGLFKPVILIPASALTALSIAELESILAHELAHIRRHDYLINLLQAVSETVLFYHPAIWIISRQLRAERENCCDDLAIAVTRDRKVYATALAAVASVRVTPLVPAASGGRLLPRLRRVLQTPDADSGYSPRWFAGVLVTGCIAIAIAAPHLQSSAKAADHPTTTPASDDEVQIHGRVLDPDGKPASGANITATPSSPFGAEDPRPASLAHATADADGRFTLAFSKSAASTFTMLYGQSGQDLWKRVQIVAAAKGFGFDWEAFDHVDAAGDVVLNLVKDVPLHGRIVDLEGKPAAGVSVTVRGMSSHILVQAADFQHPPENYRGLEKPLSALGRATPIVSDADGRFSISGLGAERRLSLEFYSEKFSLSREWVLTRVGKPMTVALGSGDRAAVTTLYGSTFELTASPARTVTGVVRDSETHKPIPGARITTIYDRVEAYARTDAEGQYRIAGFDRSKETDLRIDTPDEPYIPTIAKVPSQAGFQPVVSDIELTRGIWITGHVTDLRTKAPLPVEVDCRPLAGNKAAEKNPIFREGWATPPCNTQTSADGSFRVAGAPGPGIVAVRSSGSEYILGQGFDAVKTKTPKGAVRTLLPGDVGPREYNAVREIDAAVDSVTANVDFELDSGSIIHVTCINPDGTPAGKIRVLGNRSILMNSGTTPFADGRFDALGFTKDTKRIIVVRDEDHQLAKIAIMQLSDAHAGKVELRLEPAAKVTGRLLNPEGDPIKTGTLRLDTYIPELKQANMSGIVDVKSDSDGRFTMYIPPNLRFILGASSSPYGGQFKVVTESLNMKAGETKDLGDISPSPQDMTK